MTTAVGTPTKTSAIAAIRARMSGRSGMDGQGGVLFRKLLSGQRLTAIEREIAAATGLGAAVADLVGASKAAQGSQGVLSGAKNNANVVLKSRAVMNRVGEADAIFADHYAAYGKVSRGVRNSAVGKAVTRTAPAQERVLSLASDVFTVAGLGLSAVALPTMAKKTASSFQELTTLIHDDNATTDQRLDKAEEMVRAAGGTIFSAQGIYLGAKGTVEILSRSRTIGNVFAKLGSSKFLGFMKYHPVGKVLGALLPVADGAVFIGEAIATRRTFNDPTATGSQRARKVLDLGLAGLKVAFWMFPGVQGLRTAYKFASLGQMGLMIKDFYQEFKPKLIQAGRTFAWGVTHPVEGVKALGAWTSRTAGNVASKVGSAAGWLFRKVTDPVGTWNGMMNEVNTWRAKLGGTAPQTPAPQAIAQQPTVTAPVLPAPVPTAPAQVAPVEAAPVTAEAAPVVVETVPAPVPAVEPAPLPPVAPPALELPAVSPLAEPLPAVPAAEPASAVAQAPSEDAAFQAALAEIQQAAAPAPALF